MVEISASFSTGHTAYKHDIREGQIPKNVDQSLSHYNLVLVDKLQGKSIEEYTDEKMQPYIDEYNAKKKRPCLRINKSYSEWHKTESKNKTCPLVYEACVQIGDHETLGKIWYENQKSEGLRQFFIKQYTDILEHMQKEYPHLEIVWATIHMDEPHGTPHLHIAYQPIGGKYKQGLSHQISICNALTCDGIERVKS